MPRKTLIKHRRDTKANWKSVNPVLANGEPGLETDTNRTKIGDGVKTWTQLGYQNNPFYGAWQDSTTQTIANTTTSYPIKLNTVDVANGISVVSDGTNLTRITFTHGGVYNLQWSGQFTNTNTSGAQDIVVWLRKNGTDIAGTAGHVTITSSHGGTAGAVVASWNYLITVADGDYIQLMWHADNTAVSLAAYAAGTSPVLPTAASVIVTVQQVA